jgi:hypothetical protein
MKSIHSLPTAFCLLLSAFCFLISASSGGGVVFWAIERVLGLARATSTIHICKNGLGLSQRSYKSLWERSCLRQ